MYLKSGFWGKILISYARRACPLDLSSIALAKAGCSSIGRTLSWGGRSLEFKSPHPDKYLYLSEN